MFRNRDRQAIAPSATRTANAVGVIFRFHWQTVVKDVADSGHINTASGNIGGNQDLDPTFAQHAQAAIANALAQSAVQSGSREAFVSQVLGQRIAFNLRRSKNNGLVQTGIAQEMVEQFAAMGAVVSPVQRLLDVGMAALQRVDLDTLRCAHQIASQLLNTRRESGREHQGLGAFFCQRVDCFQVFREAQIQHAVGFVQNQKLHLVQFDLATAFQIEQTTWRSDYQRSVLQTRHLLGVRQATDDAGNAHAFDVLHQIDGIAGNLLSQLAGWAQNQSLWRNRFEVTRINRVFPAWFFRLRFASSACFVQLGSPLKAFFAIVLAALHFELMQDRQQECRRFTATRLGADHQIMVRIFGQGFRNHFSLYRRWDGEAQIADGANQFRCKTQFGKRVVFQADHGNGGCNRG